MKMKSLVAALALGFVSVGAQAAITNSAAGNSELFITLYDQGADLASAADDRAYVRDLGSLLSGGTMNDWVSATTTAPLPALNANKQGFGTIYSVGADANLSSFLAASTDMGRLKWNIVAADTSGTDRLLTTASSVVAPTYTQFRTFGGGVDINLAAMNPALTGESALYVGSNATIIGWGNNIGGRTAFSNAAGLGDSQGFFVLSERLTTGTVTLADVRQFMADPSTAMQWTLAASGDLTYGATAVLAPIPEPETYGMLLAGLGMIGFMARRRLNNRV